MKHLIIFLCTVFLMSCASVQQTSNLLQPTNTRLVAGVGDTVITISKEKNLPNIFGSSDIFGRKTPTGAITVQYLGVRKNKAIFNRKSMILETNATTMNSTPMVIENSTTTTSSGVIGGTFYNGTSTTTLPPTIISAQIPKVQILDKNTIELSIDLSKKSREFIVDGKIINIESADNTKLIYSISN